jgi:hypothetical protein
LFNICQHGRGRRTNYFWQGGNKRLQFSIHFDVDFEEFNKLFQIGFLNLVRKRDFPPPPRHGNPPLHPHPSISSIPVEPHVSLPPEIPINYGWNDIVYLPPPHVEGWPTLFLPFPPPPPPKKHAQLVVYITSHALPKNFKAQELEPSEGKRPAHFVGSNQSQSSSHSITLHSYHPRHEDGHTPFEEMHLEASTIKGKMPIKENS